MKREIVSRCIGGKGQESPHGENVAFERSLDGYTGSVLWTRSLSEYPRAILGYLITAYAMGSITDLDRARPGQVQQPGQSNLPEFQLLYLKWGLIWSRHRDTEAN